MGDSQAAYAMAKRFARTLAKVYDALQLLGGRLLEGVPMERYVRDTVHQILEGTNQIMRVIISRRMFMARPGGHTVSISTSDKLRVEIIDHTRWCHRQPGANTWDTGSLPTLGLIKP